MKLITTVLLVFAVLLAVAAANIVYAESNQISFASAKSKVSPAGRKKLRISALDKLLRDEQQEFIVKFKDTSPHKGYIANAKNRHAIVKDKRTAFRAIKSAVKRKLQSGDVQTLTEYSTLPMSHMKTRNRKAFVDLLNNQDVVAIYEIKTFYPNLIESLPLVDQPESAAIGFKGEGSTVAVIDTGADITHSAFGSCVGVGSPASCRVVAMTDTGTLDGVYDDNGHGTHVAAIVAGVAPKANLAIVDVFNRAPGSASSVTILAGMDWVIANAWQYDINVINMSLGNRDAYAGECPDSVLASVIEDAWNVGIITVVSSGNGGEANGIEDPSCAPKAVSVGAVYDDNVGPMEYRAWLCPYVVPGAHPGDLVTEYTAPDKVVCFSNSHSSLDLLAPGAVIDAADISANGTSQAAPHVAGAVAIMRSASPNDSLQRTVDYLKDTGRNIHDSKSGVNTPRLDIDDAVGVSQGLHAPTELRVIPVHGDIWSITWKDNNPKGLQGTAEVYMSTPNFGVSLPNRVEINATSYSIPASYTSPDYQYKIILRDIYGRMASSAYQSLEALKTPSNFRISHWYHGMYFLQWADQNSSAFTGTVAIQWRSCCYGGTIATINGFDTNGYTVPANYANSSYQYRLKLTDQYGRAVYTPYLNGI